MAKFLDYPGFAHLLAGFWARVKQELSGFSPQLPPGTMTRRFLTEGDDFTLSMDEQQEYDETTGLYTDKVVIAFEFLQDVNPLDEFLAYFKLGLSQEEDEGENLEQRERAVCISCGFSPHKPEALVKLHSRNVWILNELLGIDSGGVDLGTGDWGELLLLIGLLAFLDLASLAEHPVQGRWEGNTFYLELRALGDLGNLANPEAWGDFAGGAVAQLAQSVLMELIPLAELEYLRKTEVYSDDVPDL